LNIKRLRDRLEGANKQIQAQKDELEIAYNQLEADNIRKTEELEMAYTIQQGFLPVALPELTYLEIAVFQKPATEVGGDYYDFFLQKDDKLVVAIGDAAGHDVGASLMVSATKTALLIIDEEDLTEKVNKMNTVLKQINSNRLINMALVLVELSHDINSNTIRVKAVGGGMPPLYILRSNGNLEELAIRELPLGLMEVTTYGLTEFQLTKSEVLILMSDGLPERLNDRNEIFGYDRLRTEIEQAGKRQQRAKGLLESLIKSSDDWSNNTPQDDDITLVVLKVR
jgi:sigma-B regulation protein RsbU (phosphoserine phosphatase)